MNSNSSHQRESLALQEILRHGGITVDAFFEEVWQRCCAVFAYRDLPSATNGTDPFSDVSSRGWDVLIDLLDRSRYFYKENPVLEPPLIFQDQQLVSREDSSRLYGDSLFAPFLDGCSIVINHADFASPYIATLCDELQRSFPHAYANTYLTPANSQAVGAHADDRDVFIIQVYGSKSWKVYERVPIPFPYPEEQVGKGNLEVPQPVLDGPVLIERTLRAGDVLYMPRGYVHEAKATTDEPSFHITVALATHDWTLAGLLSAAGHFAWTRTSVDHRKAVSREFGRKRLEEIPTLSKESLRRQISDAIDMLRDEATIEAIHETLTRKYAQHNTRARKFRDEVLASKASTDSKKSSTIVVGLSASNIITLKTRVRAATLDEKGMITLVDRPQGLAVRAEDFDSLMHILTQLKRSPSMALPVGELRSLLTEQSPPRGLLSDFLILSFVKVCVELAVLAIDSACRHD